MGDIDEADDEGGVTEIPAVRFHLSAVFAHLFAFLANTSHAWRLFWEAIAGEVAAHTNYKVEKDQFAASVGRDIEAVAEGRQDG